MAAGLAGPDRAAVLLLTLGAEAAAEVMRHLDEREVRKVSQALARLQKVGVGDVEQIGREFQESFGAGGMAVNGRAFALSVVNQALTREGAMAAGGRDEILADLEQGSDSDHTLNALLRGVPATALLRIIEGEHPQVAAQILAHASVGEAAAAISNLPEDVQSDVLTRLARLEAVSGRFSRDLAQVLQARLKALSQPATTAFGGPKAVAQVMNHLDKEAETRIFGELESADMELAEEIRSLMFTLEDCIKLDGRSLQTVLKEVPRDDLIIALKTASEELKEKIFANMSSRAADILVEDMQASGPVRLRDVEEAQARIVAVVRELEAAGKIVLAGPGNDVLV